MKLRKKYKFYIMFIILIMLSFSIYIIYNIFFIIKYIEGNPNNIMYKNEVHDKTRYKVVLKENNFIKKNYIGPHESYITSLVDYIRTNFYYEYIGNKNLHLNYEYDIKANIISEFIDDKSNKVSRPIWNKKFIILENIKGNTNNAKLQLNETFDINLEYYNNLTENFRTTLKLPIQSRIEFKFSIKINSVLKNDEKITKDHYILMTIPLETKVFDIKINTNFSEQEIIYNKNKKDNQTIYVYIIIYIVLFILNLITGLYFIKSISNRNKNKNILRINKILKDYDDRIITVSNFINYEKVEIINVISFEELLNLSEETLEPIIYWHKKNNEVWFSILRNKILYRYIFRL